MIDGVGLVAYNVDEKGKMKNHITGYVKKPDYSHYYETGYRIDKALGNDRSSFENEI